jgi:hypothetical protein
LKAKYPPRVLSVAILLAAALVLVAGLAGCDIPGYLNGSFAYAVEPHSGGLTADIHDQRSGAHTTWIVATNPPPGRYPVWLQVTGDGDVKVSRPVQLPAGTYRYAVYSVEGSGGLPKDVWTPGNRVGQGEVTVP